MTRRDDADGDRAQATETPATRAPEDVATGLRFVHLMEAQTKAQLGEVSASLYALIETLVAQGTLPLDAYEKRRKLTVVRENQRSEQEARIAVSSVADKYALQPLPDIDCDALIPLCGARCCSLSFALSVQDLDERVVRWDYARPYHVAQRPDGSCVHNDARTRRCTVYAHRPATCRQYDCRKDSRIWIDFDKRIPAPWSPPEGANS
jgi:hypothetical protein